MKALLFTALFSFIYFSNSLSQENTGRELITKININNPLEIDTIYSKTGNNLETPDFIDHFSLDDKDRFASYNLTGWMPPYQAEYFRLFFPEKNSSLDYNFMVAQLDIFEPYIISETEIFDSPNGKWLINGLKGNFFIFNNDSVININEQPNLQNKHFRYLNGKIDSLFLLTFKEPDNLDPFGKYSFYLNDPNNAPEFSFKDSVSFPDSLIPSKIFQLKDDLYISDCFINNLNDYGLFILKRNEKTFSTVKKLELEITELYEYKNIWHFRDNFLFVENSRYKFSETDTSFIDKKDIFENPSGKFDIDRDWKLAIDISGKYLIVKDLNTLNTISEIEFNNISSYPFVDSPFVYIYYSLMQTSVGDPGNSNPANYDLTAFPNPFNSETVLNFTIPYEEKVELALYDLLGRKVQSIFNEKISAGKYTFHLNGNNLSSGNYFCVLRSNNFVKTIKIILLK